MREFIIKKFFKKRVYKWGNKIASKYGENAKHTLVLLILHLLYIYSLSYCSQEQCRNSVLPDFAPDLGMCNSAFAFYGLLPSVLSRVFSRLLAISECDREKRRS